MRRILIFIICFVAISVSILIYLNISRLSANLVAERIVELYPNLKIEKLQKMDF